jgi:hypothetical protein
VVRNKQTAIQNIQKRTILGFDSLARYLRLPWCGALGDVYVECLERAYHQSTKQIGTPDWLLAQWPYRWLRKVTTYIAQREMRIPKRPRLAPHLREKAQAEAIARLKPDAVELKVINSLYGEGLTYKAMLGSATNDAERKQLQAAYRRIQRRKSGAVKTRRGARRPPGREDDPLTHAYWTGTRWEHCVVG